MNWKQAFALGLIAPGAWDGNGEPVLAVPLQETSVDTYTPGAVGINANGIQIQGCNWYYISRSYLQHDFSHIPTGTTIKSAKLYIRCYYPYHDENYGDNTHNILRVTEPWDETTMTWNTKAAVDNTPYLSEWFPAPTTSGWFSVDITKLVQDWVNGTYPNYGLMITSSIESTNTPYRYYQWEWTTARYGDGSQGTYVKVDY